MIKELRRNKSKKEILNEIYIRLYHKERNQLTKPNKTLTKDKTHYKNF